MSKSREFQPISNPALFEASYARNQLERNIGEMLLIERNLIHATAIECPEKRYMDAAPLRHRKDFGQFFTPPNVAHLMADWITNTGAQKLLDPAFGTGVLSAACLVKNPEAKITAYEKDACILDYVPINLAEVIDIIPSDFLKSSVSCFYDGLIMNPPYIRHREINGYEKERCEISVNSSCNIPKAANLYIYFAIKSLQNLKKGGRAFFLIPSEWMSANFSASFKKYILEKNLLSHIITFSNCSNIFDDALTTASVLLLEKLYD